MSIHIKRAYDAPARTDGHRVLVDRLWPRGVSRKALQLDSWAKDVAPSTGLRKWFGHDPAKWREFKTRYFGELQKNVAAFEPVLAIARRGTVTLVHGAREMHRNNAAALKEFIERHDPKTRDTGPRSIPRGRAQKELDRKLDQALDCTFPASDPFHLSNPVPVSRAAR
jgi:uncharacterized protein YeaO (DUF488 family)